MKKILLLAACATLALSATSCKDKDIEPRTEDVTTTPAYVGSYGAVSGDGYNSESITLHKDGTFDFAMGTADNMYRLAGNYSVATEATDGSYKVTFTNVKALNGDSDEYTLADVVYYPQTETQGATLARALAVNNERAYTYLIMGQAPQTAAERTLEQNRIAGLAYVENYSKGEGVQRTASGAYYRVTEEGTGATPLYSDRAYIRYTGKLIDGSVFEQATAPLTVDNLTTGFKEVLRQLKVGSKAHMVIPYNLAYGAAGDGNIPGYSTLIFDVELLAAGQNLYVSEFSNTSDGASMTLRLNSDNTFVCEDAYGDDIVRYTGKYAVESNNAITFSEVKNAQGADVSDEIKDYYFASVWYYPDTNQIGMTLNYGASNAFSWTLYWSGRSN